MERMRATTKRMADGASLLSADMRRYGRSAEKAARSTKNISTVASAAASAMNKIHQAVGDVNSALSHTDALEVYADKLQAVREQASAYGNFETRITMVTGALSSVGGGAVAQPLYAGAQVAGAIKGFKLLKLELPGLTQQLLGSGKATKAAVSALQQFVPGMSEASAETAVAVGSFAAMAGAAAALSIALGKAKDIIEASKTATEGYLEVSRRYAELVATGTTQDLQDAIEKNRERNQAIDIERQALHDLLVQYEDAKDGAEGLTRAVLGVNEMFGLNMGGIEDVRDRLGELDTEYQNNIALESKLVNALSTGATATADMKVQEEKLAQQRAEASQAIVAHLDSEMQYRVQLAQREDTWTRDQVQARLDAIDRQRKALEEEQQALDFYNEQMDMSADVYEAKAQQLGAAISALDREAQDLTSSVVPAIKAREEETARVDELKSVLELTAQTAKNAAASVGKVGDALQEAAKRARAATNLRSDYEAKAAAIAEKRNVASIREAEDWALKQTRARADHYRDMAKFDRDYYLKRQRAIAAIGNEDNSANTERVKALQAFNKEDLRRTEDHLLRLADIERDTRSAVRDAAASLDARAVIAAQRQGKKQLDAENRKYTLEKKRRAEDFKDQLKALEAQRKERLEAAKRTLEDLRQQHERERRERIATFQREQQDAAVERSIKLQRQREDWAREDMQRRQAFQQRLAALGVFHQQRAVQEMAHYASLQNIAQAGMNAVRQTFASALNSIRSQPTTYHAAPVSGAGRGGAPRYRGGFSNFGGHFASGGWPPLERDVWTGEDGPELARFYGGPWKIFAHGQKPPRENLTINVPVNINADGGKVGALANMQEQMRLESAIRRGVLRSLAEVFGGTG